MPKMPSLRKATRLVRRRPARVDLSHPARSPLGSSVVGCAVYADGWRRSGRASAAEAVAEVRKRGGDAFVWIGLHEPHAEELAGIAGLLGLHRLIVHDAVHAHQRAKVERYDDTLVAVVKTVRYVEHTELTATSEVVDTGEIMVITGADFVITVRHGGHGSLGPLREELENDPQQLAYGPAAVLHAVTDRAVDTYLDVCDALQEDLDTVEAAVFSDHRGRGAEAAQIHQLKRELLEFKHAVMPLLRPLRDLVQQPPALLAPGPQRYFQHTAGNLARVCEQVSGFDSLIDSILQANLAQVSVAQNEDMRRITAWAAILAVPTMVCGVYGMNFDHMPELRWTYGYPLVMAVIVTACWTIHRGFRRNGWL